MTPATTAAYALASPVPRVLWKCAPSGRSPMTGRTALDQVGDAARRRGADGVGDRDAVGAEFAGGGGDVDDARGSVGPSNGQSQAVAMMTSIVAPLLVGDAGDVGDQVRGVGRGPADVGLAVAVGGRHDVLDATPCPRRPRGLRRRGRPPARRTRRRVTPEAGQLGGQCGGVGECGHLRRRHERGGLDLADAGRDDGLEQFELGGQRDRLLDLQPVAQADLADRRRGWAGRSPLTAPLLPSAPRGPRLTGRAGRRRPRRCADPAAPTRVADGAGRLGQHRHHAGALDVAADALIPVVGDHAAGLQLRVGRRPRRRC